MRARNDISIRQHTRADVRSETFLAIGSWLIVGFSCLQVLLYAYGRDQTMFAVIADRMLAGRVPYRDVWDVKTPGIFVVFTAAQALFGRSMVSIRILEAAGLLGMVVAFRELARATKLPDGAGLLGGALAVLVHAELGFWHTAQPESFAGMLTVYALAVGAFAWRKIGRGARRSLLTPSSGRSSALHFF